MAKKIKSKKVRWYQDPSLNLTPEQLAECIALDNVIEDVLFNLREAVSEYNKHRDYCGFSGFKKPKNKTRKRRVKS